MKAKQDNRVDGGIADSSNHGAKSPLVELQLERIFANGEFSRAHLVKRMLRFMVERKLAGQDLDLNERTIATRVFERGEDWDSKVDPVVRLTAMRLRTKLDGYYASAGKEDQVVISVPKGQYVPIIEVLPAAQAQQPPLPAPISGRPTTGKVLAWTAAMLAAVIAITLWTRHRPDTASSLVLPVAPVSTELGTQFAPALSPDGSSVAYVSDGDGHNLDIYIRYLHDGMVSRVTSDPDPDLNPSWSPDGKWLAFLRVHGERSTLIIVPTAHPKTERSITSFRAELGKWVGDASPLIGNPGPEWSVDSKSVLLSITSDDGSAHSINAVSIVDGSRQEIILTEGEIRDFYPRLSPDGRHLAFARYATHGAGEIYVADADGANLRRLTSNGKTIQGLSWAPDGSRIIFGSNRSGSFQLWEVGIDGGNVRQLALNSSSAAQPTIRGEKLLFVETSENWNIWRSDIVLGKASPPTRFISSSGRNYDPRVSPDGKTIAFVSDRSGGWQLWLADLDGGNIRQLTSFTTAWLGTPSWSPDGKRIAFDARPDGRSGIFVAEVSTGAVSVLQKSDAEERSPSWSRDGRSIYFNSSRDGTISVYRKDLVTGTISRMTQSDVFGSGESFDGKTLFFDTQHTGELWRENIDGTQRARIPGAPHLFPTMAWTVFRGGLYFASDDDHSDQYTLLSLTDRKVSVIGKTTAPIVSYTPSLGTSPDGSILLFAQQDQIRSNIKMSRIESR